MCVNLVPASALCYTLGAFQKKLCTAGELWKTEAHK
jgi:hypothetical protein